MRRGWEEGRESPSTKNNVLFLDSAAKGRAECWDRESQRNLAFFFTRYLFPVPGCLPWGGHPWGQFLFPCHCWPSLPECDTIVSWGTVQRCQGRREVAHASAISLQQKKKRALNLGTLGFTSSLWCVRRDSVQTLPVGTEGLVDLTWEPLGSHPSEAVMAHFLLTTIFMQFPLGILERGRGERYSCRPSTPAHTVSLYSSSLAHFFTHLPLIPQQSPQL